MPHRPALSIRHKLRAIVMLTSGAALLVASVAFTLYDRSTFLHAKTQDLSAAARMVGSNSTAALSFGDTTSAREVLAALQAKQTVNHACIYDRDGRVFATYRRDASSAAFTPPPPQTQGTAIVNGRLALFQPIAINGRSIGTIFIEADLTDLDARLTTFLRIDFLVLLGSLAVAFVLSTRFEGVILRPIRELADTALSVSTRDDYSIRATKRSNDEIGVLFDQFNSMLGRIEQGDVAVQQARNELEDRVAERTSYLNALIENSPLAIMVVDADHMLQLCNPAFEALFQCVAADDIGKPIAALFPKEATLPEASPATGGAASTTPGGLTTRRERKDGTVVEVELHLVPLTVQGRVRGTLGIYKDVTERRTLEKQLRMAQKMEAVGRLSGGIAHDFNNLLGVILGYLPVMKRQLTAGTPLFGYAEEIEKAGQRAVSLTRQLLAFSRQQVLEPVVLNLNALVTDMEKLLPRLIGEDVDLQVALDPAIGQVKADPGQIEQVVMNLVVNARDAMPDGGRVTIRTANVDLDAAYVREHAGAVAGPYVMLAVADTGTGMDPDIQAHIFEPFFTTKETDKGTGLGLATVYGVVKQSSGYISVVSQKGTGSTFSVYLPRIDQAVEARRESLQARRATRGTETILLVEDAEPLRRLAHMFLADNGYHVLAAADGLDALRVAAATTAPIHLLLTDVVMPGMNGRALAARLAPGHPAMQVLYMSGYTDAFIKGHGVLEEGIHLLHKPFTEDVLVGTVRDLLDGRLTHHGETADCR